MRAPIVCILFACPAFAGAAPDASTDASTEVVVEATRLTDPPASAAATIVSSEEIQRQNRQSLSEVLRNVPGVDVSQAGGAGHATSVYLRGGEARHTLVLVDGVAANEPMAVGGAFDFGNLDSTNVERVEIFRGPQGVRFGSGAVGGVINVVTKAGHGPSRANVALEGGSYDTWRASTNASGKEGRVDYSLGLDAFKTGGFSAASEARGNLERDGDDRQTLSARVGADATSTARIDWTMRFTRNRADLDYSGGAGGDDPNDSSTYKQFLTGVAASDRYLDGRLLSTVRLSYASVDRIARNLPDAIRADDTTSGYQSETMGVETTQELLFGDEHSLRLDLQNSAQSGFATSTSAGVATLTDRREETLSGEALTYLFDGRSIYGELGARANQVSTGDASPNYRAVVGARLPSSTTMQVVYGTGFKAPSLDELYGNFGANPNLKAERAASYEASIEQKIGERGAASVSYFNVRYDDLIRFTSRYENVAQAKAEGAEISALVDAAEFLHIKISGKYLDAQDETNRQPLARRPRVTASAETRWHSGRFEASLAYRYVGARPDVDAVSGARIDMPDHSVFDLGGSFTLSPEWRLTARVENLFDRQYEEINGYGTAGLSAYVGARSFF